LCGARLRDLGLPYTRIVTSTMPRAVETGDIICKYLSPELPLERCGMLKEGAPIAPEPAVGNYRPEEQVPALRRFLSPLCVVEIACIYLLSSFSVCNGAESQRLGAVLRWRVFYSVHIARRTFGTRAITDMPHQSNSL